MDDAGWIVTGYLLGYTVAMPLLGRLADVRGRRLMYVVSLVLVSVGSALCVVATRLDVFIASHVIMAVGGGALPSYLSQWQRDQISFRSMACFFPPAYGGPCS